MISELISKLQHKTDLTYDEMNGVMTEILSGNTNIAENVDFLSSLAEKGETDDELLGMLDKMQELSLKIETVRNLMRGRILPAIKVGGSWRTTRRALYEYLEDQMGLQSRVHGARGKNSGNGILQAKKRSKTVGKGRKKSPDGKPKEVFFTR